MANGKSHTPGQSKAPSLAPRSQPKPASGKGRPVKGQSAPTTGPGGANNARDAAGKVSSAKC
jgi:hypothetical protein